MLATLVATLVVMGLLVVLMAVGVLLGHRPMEPECKALERLATAEGIPLCDACDEVEECPLKEVGLVRRGTTLAAADVLAGT